MTYHISSKQASSSNNTENSPSAYQIARTQQLVEKVVVESGLLQSQAQGLWQALWQPVQRTVSYLQQIQQWLQTQRKVFVDQLRRLRPAQRLSRSEWLALAMAAGLMVGQASQPFVAEAAGPAGSEFKVNTHTTDQQQTPVIAMDSDGDFVIVWTSGLNSGVSQDGDSYGIYAQRYDASGSAVGAEFRVNNYTTGTQAHPSVAMDSDGDFVVVWSSINFAGTGQDGSSYGIYAQRYDASGSTVGTEFKVNSYTTGGQSRPSVAMDNEGDFVVAWRSYNQDGNGYGIYAQQYDASGSSVGTEFKVNSYTTGGQFNPTVGMDSDGDFVIAWSSSNQDGDSEGVYAQRYDASGSSVGTEFKVNSYTTGGQSGPSVGMDSEGDFVVVWRSLNQDGNLYGVYAQRYNASGAAQGSEFRVNTYTTFAQRNPSVAMNSDGDFVVTWDSGSYGSTGQDGSDYGVYAQRYDASGIAQGSEFQVNTYTTSNQGGAFYGEPAIALDSDGDFVVTWGSGTFAQTQDGSRQGIYAQRYTASKSYYLPIINKP